MTESDAVDPTERINFVQRALLGILEAFPPHEVCLGKPADVLPLTYPSAEC